MKKKILPISPKLNFTPNTLGCYWLKGEFWMFPDKGARKACEFRNSYCLRFYEHYYCVFTFSSTSILHDPAGRKV